METKMTLVELRKEASKLGIKNYVRYDKPTLLAMIETKKQGSTVCIDPEYDEKEEVIVDEATGEEVLTPEKDGLSFHKEVIKPTDKKSKTEKESFSSRIVGTIEKPSKEEVIKEEKKTSSTKKETVIKHREVRTLVSAKPIAQPKQGTQSEMIYTAIINNPEMSLNQIAKQNGVYYSSVQRVAEKYFGNKFDIKKKVVNSDSKTAE